MTKKQMDEGVRVDTDVRRCICDGLDNAIKNGIKSMQEEHAPTFLIDDYIFDMISGGWINCKCEASKST